MEANVTTAIKLVVMCLALYVFGRIVFGFGAVEMTGQEYLSSMKKMMHKDTDMPTFSDVASDMQDKAMRELFSELDTNKDGVIQYEEFSGMTLNTWAAFRALDLALKTRLKLPSFSKLRSTIQEQLMSLNLNIPDELRLFREANWGEQLRFAFTRYVFFLVFLQCCFCAWENMRGFVGLRPFTFPSSPDPEKVPHSQKEVCLKYDTPLEGWYEITKVAVVSLSGLPILRMVQVVVFVAMGMTAVNIAVMIPSKHWKNFWMRGVVSLCISATLFSLGYYRVGVEGKVAPREECKLLVGNHTAVIEILILFGLNFPSFISATENAAVPLFSGVVRACDAILVDRKDPRSRKQTMHEIRKRASDPEAPQLMVFPEGTLNNQKALFKFKAGAFETGQAVQPVVFKYPYTHFNPCWTGESTGGNDFGETMWRTLCQFVNHLEVKVLPPYRPSEAEKENKFLFADNVRKLMAAHLRCGVCDCAFEDYVLLQRRFRMLKRTDKKLGKEKGWWFPFYRRRRVTTIDLSPLSDDDCNSVTSCEESSPGK